MFFNKTLAFFQNFKATFHYFNAITSSNFRASFKKMNLPPIYILLFQFKFIPITNLMELVNPNSQNFLMPDPIHLKLRLKLNTPQQQKKINFSQK